MFGRLSDQLQGIVKNLRGQGRISESNVAEAVRGIRMALLDADVDYKVAKEFTARVKEQALGESVMRSVTPGQQIVKIFHEELRDLLGGDSEPLRLDTTPARILMVGLNGAGKTTSSAKLARLLKAQGRSPVLIACDLRRPAAVEQLAVLAGQADVPVFKPDTGGDDVLAAASQALDWCASHGGDVQIFDSAGRQDLDEALIAELKALASLLDPAETLLVADAATGQQAVSVANHFHEALGLTGIVLTKLDGDARGGAALSMRAVTGRPIKLAGTGEKLDQFEQFHPDRLAGRILGMGDVVSLVERAAEAISEDEALLMERKLRTAGFDLNDFLQQFKMLKRMGPLEGILGMIPGMDKLKGAEVDEGQMKRVEAIILSMTPAERTRPDILNARRRQRIARGSGVAVSEVNNLILRFNQMRKMMKNMGAMKKLMARAGGGAGVFPGS
jgi:signal recognition particle subunit SRP54